MKALFIFSNPPDQTPLRLDREDKIVASLAKQHADKSTIERLHASEVEDVLKLILSGEYEVLHFSGHGSPEGIYLDRADLAPTGEMVSAARLQSMIALAASPPKLVVILCCFSEASIDILATVAPFVITAVGAVRDEACLHFCNGLYERLFDGWGIKLAFEQACQRVQAKGMRSDCFRLHRPKVFEQKGSKFIECTPDPKRAGILVNLNAVADKLDSFGMPEEELFHLLARKLKIHYWIFSIPRERCVIPIDKLLFGEFTWQDAEVGVQCTRLMKLRADTPIEHMQIWHRLLISYNDLASSEYRSVPNPAAPGNARILVQAVRDFQHNVEKYLLPARDTLTRQGFTHLLPYLEFVATHCDAAADHLTLERFPQTIKSLEEALTNFHELVDGLCPPAEPLD
jgi:hypothetical protein